MSGYIPSDAMAAEQVFRAIGRVERFQRIQREFTNDMYGKLCMESLAFLEGLAVMSV